LTAVGSDDNPVDFLASGRDFYYSKRHDEDAPVIKALSKGDMATDLGPILPSHLLRPSILSTIDHVTRFITPLSAKSNENSIK
jgi:hypothetical protein